ncbi:MAG TPA: peptidylprolyl isomerase [Candidatus Binatia bacterium]|jgi:cyclophilin family peptidyl-prolyl cis-trans isomerase
MAEANQMENPVVCISTSAGDVWAEIFVDQAPVSADNFLAYVREGFYDGLIFHRVIPRFMIQGGGFDKDMKQKKAKAPIKNEAGNGLKNLTGTLAMARTNVVDSATSQFFINAADNDFLDHRNNSPDGFGYAVFGRVTNGTEVVQKIEKARTGSKGLHQDVPIEPVVIKSITVSS